MRTYNVSCARGEHFILDVVIYDGTAVTAADISAWTATLKVFAAWNGDDGTPAPVFTVASEAPDNVTKTIQFIVPRAQTSLLELGGYVYDVWRDNAAAEKPLVKGSWSVDAGRAP